MTTIEHTAIDIDPILLDECARIWLASNSPVPPSPYEVVNMDSARLQVVTWVNIKQYFKDEAARKKLGL